ncbi:MAG: type II secretion system F family protein [Planctomycetota bacterium]|jgi:type IV pilus assembly protein PilC|nr:type II secretion system F family protein [Planctomycetota bacterium]
MNAYKYQIKRPSGQVVAGVLKAESQMIATQEARALGGTLLELVRLSQSDVAGGGLLERLGLNIGKGVNSKELMAFTSQLACMAKAGIGLTTALDSIGEQITTKGMGEIVRTLKHDVESGRQFSEALRRFPKVFSVLYVNMVKASELTGSFGHMLERITEYLTQQAETKRQVIGAMVYPLIIVSMAITTTVFMLVFVLPRFMVLFKGREDILPLPTKILMAASASMTGFWYLYLLAGIGAAVGATYFVRTEFGRTWWDMAKLKIPILKNLCHALYLSRGLRTMGELVNAGVPMLDTIAITAEVSGNIHYARIWQRVYNAIRKGQRIAPTLSRSAFIPQSVAQMISAGEETGTLAEILKDVSDFYDKQLKATIKTVTGAIEPLMIILMGGVVAFIAAAILLPIFKMSQLVN